MSISEFITLTEAAAICGLSIAAYKGGVLRGHFPAPKMPYRKVSRSELTRALGLLCSAFPVNVTLSEDDYFEAQMRKRKSYADVPRKRKDRLENA